MRSEVKSGESDGWQPMSTAPTTGYPVQHVRGKLRDGTIVDDMHYAYDESGEEQPPFRGWFVTVNDHTFGEVDPVAWVPRWQHGGHLQVSAANAVSVDRFVLLRCARSGCPRSLKIAFDDTMPPETSEVRSYCPWHESSGGYDSESYYDAQGNQLLPGEQQNGELSDEA